MQGWGVRHITLLDSGRVSFSNPVRQSLFTYEDCLNGGRPKAAAAAEALKRIFPGVVRTHLPVPARAAAAPAGPNVCAPRRPPPLSPWNTHQTATGLEISVPMPGHTVTNEAATHADVARLEELVAAHDVVFLLMDTRESRWLPTMLSSLHNKV